MKRKSDKVTLSQLARLQALEKETTDPFAARLVHEIVSELEARLGKRQTRDEHGQERT